YKIRHVGTLFNSGNELKLLILLGGFIFATLNFDRKISMRDGNRRDANLIAHHHGPCPLIQNNLSGRIDIHSYVFESSQEINCISIVVKRNNDIDGSTVS